MGRGKRDNKTKSTYSSALRSRSYDEDTEGHAAPTRNVPRIKTETGIRRAVVRGVRVSTTWTEFGRNLSTDATVPTEKFTRRGARGVVHCTSTYN